MREEPIREDCEKCNANGKVTWCCDATYRSIGNYDEGFNVCDNCDCIEPDLVDCDACGGNGYLTEIDLIEQRHNRSQAEADDHNKATKEGLDMNDKPIYVFYVLVVLQGVLLGLKLLGIIDWGWSSVLLPIIIPLAILFGLLLMGMFWIMVFSVDSGEYKQPNKTEK